VVPGEAAVTKVEALVRQTVKITRTRIRTRTRTRIRAKSKVAANAEVPTDACATNSGSSSSVLLGGSGFVVGALSKRHEEERVVFDSTRAVTRTKSGADAEQTTIFKFR